LYRRFQEDAEVRRWYRYLDWFLTLPPQDEKVFLARITRFEEERTVPFITNAERFGMEKGREEGVQKGREEMLRTFLSEKFGPQGETLLAGRELKLTHEAAATLLKKILAADTLEDARLALEAK